MTLGPAIPPEDDDAASPAPIDAPAVKDRIFLMIF